MVNLLLETGVDVDITGPDCRTALRAAAWAGHEEIVRRLLAAGAEVNRPDAEGRTPLIAAAYMGCVSVIDILADAGMWALMVFIVAFCKQNSNPVRIRRGPTESKFLNYPNVNESGMPKNFGELSSQFQQL